jgi:hypothetical protein
MIADSLLQCSSCGANVSFVVASPEGQQFGPYTFQSLQEYVAQGQINPNSSASLGGSAWMPVTQALAAVAPFSAPAPAAGHPAVMPSAPQPQGPPGVYQGNAAAAQRPTRKAAKKRAIPLPLVGQLVVVGDVLLVVAVGLHSFLRKPGRISDLQFPTSGVTDYGGVYMMQGTVRVWWHGKMPPNGLALQMDAGTGTVWCANLGTTAPSGDTVTFNMPVGMEGLVHPFTGTGPVRFWLTAMEKNDAPGGGGVLSNKVTITVNFG